MEVFFLSDDEVLNFMIFSFLLVEQRFTFFLLYHYKMDKMDKIKLNRFTFPCSLPKFRIIQKTQI